MLLRIPVPAQLLCHAAGGPEVITCRGLDEAKLGVPPKQWEVFMSVAASAASVFLSPYHRKALLAVVADLKPELCVGLSVAAGGRSSAQRKLEAAGFEAVDAIAALAKASGNEDRALELLVGGWKPPAAPNAQGFASVDRRCPFSGATTTAGGCPFAAVAASSVPGASMTPPAVTRARSGVLPLPLAQTVWLMSERSSMGSFGIAAALNLDVAMVEATLAPTSVDVFAAAAPLPEPLAGAAWVMFDRGLPHNQIAQSLAVPVAAVSVTLGGREGGVIGSSLQARLDELLEEEAALCCPVTLVLFVEPVKAGDGHLYERGAAVELTTDDGKFHSPMTRTASPAADIEPAHKVRERVTRYRIERCEALATLVREAASEPALPVCITTAAVDRMCEYLASLRPADVAFLASPISAACDALLKLVHSPANPQGTWRAKPKDARRVNALKLQVTSGHGESADLRILTCFSCHDDYPALQGIECRPRGPVQCSPVGEQKPSGLLASFFGAGGGAPPPPPPPPPPKGESHFLCDECLAGHVAVAIDDSNLETFGQKGGVCCAHPGCKAPPYEEALLAKMLPQQRFDNYLKAKETLAKQRITAEKLPKHWQRLPSGQARAEVEGLALVRLPITPFEDLLTVPDPLELGYGRDVAQGPWCGRQSGKSLSLAAVWRIENPGLWKQYVVARDAVAEDCKRLRILSGLSFLARDAVAKLQTELQPKLKKVLAAYTNEWLDESINETFLLHGTKPEVLLSDTASLLSNGPNEKFSGGLFGEGIYLAENACKNDQYVSKDESYQSGGELKALHQMLYPNKAADHPGSVHYLVLCRVVMGCFVSTKDGDTDAKDATVSVWAKTKKELSVVGRTHPPIHHHALVAQAGADCYVKRHREFLQFHGARVYPAYLLGYKRILSGAAV